MAYKTTDSTDFNLDLNQLVDYLFYGGKLCDPCDCDSYPSSCNWP